jgi:hypothetical protein
MKSRLKHAGFFHQGANGGIPSSFVFPIPPRPWLIFASLAQLEARVVEYLRGSVIGKCRRTAIHCIEPVLVCITTG